MQIRVIYVGAELPCACGAMAQYHGRHTKTFESVLGPLQLGRAYYHCPQCQSGFCPRDRDLKLELFSLTPGVLRMIGSAAALLSFEESRELLRDSAGIEVSTKQVERAAEALGAEIAVNERQSVERMGELAPTMYLGMDGTGVPMRAEEVAEARPPAMLSRGTTSFRHLPRYTRKTPCSVGGKWPFILGSPECPRRTNPESSRSATTFESLMESAGAPPTARFPRQLHPYPFAQCDFQILTGKGTVGGTSPSASKAAALLA